MDFFGLNLSKSKLWWPGLWVQYKLQRHRLGYILYLWPNQSCWMEFCWMLISCLLHQCIVFKMFGYENSCFKINISCLWLRYAYLLERWRSTLRERERKLCGGERALPSLRLISRARGTGTLPRILTTHSSAIRLLTTLETKPYSHGPTGPQNRRSRTARRLSVCIAWYY